jgi:hypothetical protein
MITTEVKRRTARIAEHRHRLPGLQLQLARHLHGGDSVSSDEAVAVGRGPVVVAVAVTRVWPLRDAASAARGLGVRWRWRWN